MDGQDLSHVPECPMGWGAKQAAVSEVNPPLVPAVKETGQHLPQLESGRPDPPEGPLCTSHSALGILDYLGTGLS